MKAARGPRNGASSTTVSAGGSRLRRWRIPSAIAIAGLVLGLCASSASASFLYYRTTHNSADLVYAGLTNGEHNFVTEQLSGGELLYTEVGGPLITDFPDMCREITPIQVACSTEVAPGRPWTELAFEMHNNDDFVDARTSVPTKIEGGAGADILKGGSGADEIVGDGDFDDDPDGDDTIDGRGGADNMNGDGGSDTVTYAGRTPPVFVSIDGVANDGHGGEGDNVQPSVENLIGGKSADQLTGNGSANVLTGGPGSELPLEGGIGARSPDRQRRRRPQLTGGARQRQAARGREPGRSDRRRRGRLLHGRRRHRLRRLLRGRDAASRDRRRRSRERRRDRRGRQRPARHRDRLRRLERRPALRPQRRR